MTQAENFRCFLDLGSANKLDQHQHRFYLSLQDLKSTITNEDGINAKNISKKNLFQRWHFDIY